MFVYIILIGRTRILTTVIKWKILTTCHADRWPECSARWSRRWWIWVRLIISIKHDHLFIYFFFCSVLLLINFEPKKKLLLSDKSTAENLCFFNYGIRPKLCVKSLRPFVLSIFLLKWNRYIYVKTIVCTICFWNNKMGDWGQYFIEWKGGEGGGEF